MKQVLICFLLILCFCFPFVTVHAQEEDAQDQELLNKIEELEKRVNELTEQSRARRKLEITDQEKEEKEKEVLDAVSTDYTIDPKHSLGLNYGFTYSYSPGERFDVLDLDVQRYANHTLKHSISTSYSVLNNLSTSVGIPFVYRYNKLGTEDELDETDIGDISLGIGFQPYKGKTGQIRTTLSLGAGLPTGRSPYKINTDTELSTGSGAYSFSLSANFSKQVDPVVVFWNLGYSTRLPLTSLDYEVSEGYILEKVEQGDSISFGGGLAYALSYKVSVNASFSYSYSFSSDYYYRGASEVYKGGDSAGGSMSFGMGWKVSPKTTLSFSVGYGLTGSGFTFSFRMPFTFII